MLDSHPHLMCGPELPWLSTQMRALLEHLDLDWSERVLSPHEHSHDVDPRPREGIGAFARRRGIDPTRAGRWQHELTRAQRRATVRCAEATLRRLGYPPTRLESGG